MSRFSSSSRHHQHHVQSTSSAAAAAASTSMSTTTETGDVNGGHCASPYLRRFRIPKLNTFRHHLEEDEDDDEWFEMQMAKNDLIRIRMNELKTSRMKDRTNNNNVRKSMKASTSPPTVDGRGGAKKQINERSDDVESRNGNRCPAADEYSVAISEMQTTKRCLWFHPKHLFDIAPSATALKTTNKTAAAVAAAGEH